MTGGESGPLAQKPRGPIETVVAKVGDVADEIKNKTVSTVTGIKDWFSAAGDKLLGRDKPGHHRRLRAACRHPGDGILGLTRQRVPQAQPACRSDLRGWPLRCRLAAGKEQGRAVPKILIAFVFVLVAVGSRVAQAQPQACVLDCMAKDQFCQTPCFDKATQCRAACKAGDRKCVRACKCAQRACVKPCTTDYKKCAVACNKRR